jgi:hypothetical protein
MTPDARVQQARRPSLYAVPDLRDEDPGHCECCAAAQTELTRLLEMLDSRSEQTARAYARLLTRTAQ